MTETTALTLTDVLAQVKKWGLNLKASTFWKYYGMGILPKGKKLKGRGNVLYFPETTPQRLFSVHWMCNVVGIPLAEIKRINKTRWDNPTAMDVIVRMTLAIGDLGLWDKRLKGEDLRDILLAVNKQFSAMGIDT